MNLFVGLLEMRDNGQWGTNDGTNAIDVRKEVKPFSFWRIE